ncbi:substrate-binding domain-containing protein, partial [bacterium]|nr:substrate-binding domain-containing protein [bacterium]
EQEEEEEEEEEEVKKLGEGLVIYAQAAGIVGDPVTRPIASGMRAAAEMLGVELHIQYAEWYPENMVSQFQEAIAAQPDGIVITGLAGEEAMRPFVEEAYEKGIIVTGSLFPLPGFSEEFGAQGFGFAGSVDIYERARNHTTKVIEGAGLKAGDRVLVYSITTTPLHVTNTAGMVDKAEEEGLIVDHIELDEEVTMNPSLAIPVIAGYLAANPDCKAILIWHGILTAAAGELLDGAGLGPDDIFFAGADVSQQTGDALKAGWCDLTSDSLWYLGGFYPIVSIVLTKLYGFPGLDIAYPPQYVDVDNIDDFLPLIEMGVR